MPISSPLFYESTSFIVQLNKTYTKLPCISQG
jgi:hypothetical protein